MLNVQQSKHCCHMKGKQEHHYFAEFESVVVEFCVQRL